MSVPIRFFMLTTPFSLCCHFSHHLLSPIFNLSPFLHFLPSLVLLTTSPCLNHFPVLLLVCSSVLSPNVPNLSLPPPTHSLSPRAQRKGAPHYGEATRLTHIQHTPEDYIIQVGKCVGMVGWERRVRGHWEGEGRRIRGGIEKGEGGQMEQWGIY